MQTLNEIIKKNQDLNGTLNYVAESKEGQYFVVPMSFYNEKNMKIAHDFSTIKKTIKL